jgi:hypothetical protein
MILLARVISLAKECRVLLGKSKLAETVKSGVAEAGLLVRAALALSGAALVVACLALLLVLRRPGRVPAS